MTATSPEASPIALLPPSGLAGRVGLLGRGCPPSLAVNVTAEGPFAVVIVAPALAERKRAWLEGALRRAAADTQSGGVIYVLTSRRRQAGRLLRQNGFSIALELAHVPDYEQSTFLVAISPQALRYAARELLLLPRWRRRALAAASPFPFLVRAAARSVGLAAVRKGGRPPLAWTGACDDDGGAQPAIVVSRTRARNRGAFVLHRIGRRSHPSSIAKVTVKPSERATLRREAAALTSIAPAARHAGADVPRIVTFRSVGDASVLVQTALDGNVAATALAAEPHRLADVASRVADWLSDWHAATARRVKLTGEDLERMLLAPARQLAPLLTGGAVYLERLERLSETALGREATVVSVHGDLTLWNVLLTHPARIGVVDWEAARVDGPPLIDLHYSLVDAVAAITHYGDRYAAFRSCFQSEGGHATLTGLLTKRLRDRLSIADWEAELSFHACWLEHAANEAASSASHSPRPFLRILEAVTAGAGPALRARQET